MPPTYERVAIGEPQTDEGSAVQLSAYLRESDDELAPRLLEELVERHVTPVASWVVAAQMRRYDASHQSQREDIVSDAVVAFLLRVEAMRGGRIEEPIENLPGFVSVLARRACSNYIRGAYPEFHRLRNQLRYTLDKYPEFAQWQDASGERICGLAKWNRRKATSPGRTTGSDLTALEDLAATKHPADLLQAVFERLKAPLRFDDLAGLVATLWNVQEATQELQENDQPESDACPADVAIGRREWLVTLWEQIGKLARNQCAALLLNLKDSDGGCALSLFVATGVAGVCQIAGILGYSPEEFAPIWNRIPLPDLEIAELLGMTRQQVINQRKCAREKLARKMRDYDRP